MPQGHQERYTKEQFACLSAIQEQCEYAAVQLSLSILPETENLSTDTANSNNNYIKIVAAFTSAATKLSYAMQICYSKELKGSMFQNTMQQAMEIVNGTVLDTMREANQTSEAYELEGLAIAYNNLQQSLATEEEEPKYFIINKSEKERPQYKVTTTPESRQRLSTVQTVTADTKQTEIIL